MIDLSFIKSPVHRKLIIEIHSEMINDDEVMGVFVQGSVARGENYESSDLDLFVLLNEGLKRSFLSEYKSGILVEYKYSNFESALEKCKTQPIFLYNFLNSIILFDRHGKLNHLNSLVNLLFDKYQVSQNKMKSIAYWLESALIKITAAEEENDLIKACFVVSTTSWKIIEGIWAVNNRPTPPNGSVLYYFRYLDNTPKKDITSLFIGNEKARIKNAKIIISWTINRLKQLSVS